MSGPIKSDNVEAITRSWEAWLRYAGECNPRRVTLTVWASYNVITTEEVLDKVWESFKHQPEEMEYV
jgi:hypothetical protein